MEIKVRVDFLIAAVVVVSTCMLAPCLLAQSADKPLDGMNENFMRFVQSLQISTCIEDVPAPTLFVEPDYTKGSTNQVGFQLPALESLPFDPDSIKTPFVLTHVRNRESGAVSQFPRPVVLTDQSVQFEQVGALQNDVRYDYTSALFLPRCKVDCDAVIDSSQLELHCSAFQDSVWSIQDDKAPAVTGFRIPEANDGPHGEWLRASDFSITAQASDSAGVWQAFLFRRQCGESDWGSAAGDSTFAGALTGTGYNFETETTIAFTQSLPDGCYQFRVEARDATHTPASSFPDFELAGKGGMPAAEAVAQLEIRLDVTAPTSVELTCAQVMNDITLNWTPSQDGNLGIGVAGYRVLRDGGLVATLSADKTNFVETFSSDQTDQKFAYQVQPFDSLGNLQSAGGEQSCQFSAVAIFAMQPEPAFTAGTSNQVCWTSARDVPSFTAFSMQAGAPATLLSVALQDTCLTFTDLEDGAAYLYWVEATDLQQRVIRSDTVSSTQDATLPQVTQLMVDGLVASGGKRWVTTRDITVRLSAGDTAPGLLDSLSLFENNGLKQETSLSAVARLDTAFVYAVSGPRCSNISLSARVVDAAGNGSAVQTTDFYLDADPPSPVLSLSCQQVQATNAVELTWPASSDGAGCSGLAGYRILRDDQLVATVAATATSYTDLFADNTPTSRFVYQVLPVDSLGNLPAAGARQPCDYVGVSQIVLEPVPEFVTGLSNTICWSVSGSLPSLALFADASCNATVEDSVVFVGLAASQGCYTFDNLSDGQTYCYWISARDEQGRPVFSDTLASTQDNTKPVLETVEFPDGQILGRQIWTFSRDIRLALQASDRPPGEIWNYLIRENGRDGAAGTFADSSARVELVLDYSLQTSVTQATPISLSVVVIDGAGNESGTVEKTIFLQEKPPDLFAFPNPFNPMSEEVTLRLNNENETEVRIYDFFGNLVRIIQNKVNSHDFQWDGRNGRGEYVANGGYVCIGSKTKTRFKLGVFKKTL